MANRKRVTIPKSRLSVSTDTDSGSYVFRYRIVSEDKNRTSHWSAIYRVDAEPVADILANNDETLDSPVIFTSSFDGNNFVNIYWKVPQSLSTAGPFDVFANFGSTATGTYDGWTFQKSTSETEITIPISNGYDIVQLAIQVPTFPKERFVNATIFEQTHSI